MKIFSAFIFLLFLTFIGCSPDVTEEQTTGVKYETTQVQTTDVTKDQVSNSVSQETKSGQQTIPEYIPQAPGNPPPITKQEYGEVVEPEKKIVEQPVVEPVKVEEYQYKLQIFASKSKLNAENQAKILRNRVPNQIVRVEEDGMLYKVRLGPYSKWEHAKSVKDVAVNLGYSDAFIITEVKK